MKQARFSWVEIRERNHRGHGEKDFRQLHWGLKEARLGASIWVMEPITYLRMYLFDIPS
jgi:hypothetical protein